MEWEVEYTDEFGEWWDTLTEAEQISVDAHARKGAARPQYAVPLFERHWWITARPYARIASAERWQAVTRVLRFRSLPIAILLIGGDKTGEMRFYDRMISLADTLYDEHLAELVEEKGHGG